MSIIYEKRIVRTKIIKGFIFKGGELIRILILSI